MSVIPNCHIPTIAEDTLVQPVQTHYRTYHCLEFDFSNCKLIPAPIHPDNMSDEASDLSAASKKNAKQTVDPIKSFLSGGFGGMSAVLVGHPFDLTKTRLQTAAPGESASNPFVSEN